MTLKDFTAKVQEIVSQQDSLGAKVKFVLDKEVVFIDATQKPNVVNNVDGEADCTIISSLNTVSDLLTGKTSAMTALMFGKVKIKGDSGIAMKVAQMISK
jgi:putative sterol carrier protein